MVGTTFKRGMVFAIVCLTPLRGFAGDVKVTDGDRVFRTFAREAATVGSGKIRVEVRGFTFEDIDETRLDIFGFPNDELEVEHARKDADTTNDDPIEVDKVNGGIIDVLGSYGIGDSGEVGFTVPFAIQKTRFADGDTIRDQDVSDISFYGKWKFQMAENCAMAGGVELTVPTGPEGKRFGTGEVAVNPFISTRYQYGRFSVGAQIGYQIFTGGPDDVVNYSVTAIAKATEIYSFRLELVGRYFETGDPVLRKDTEFHDVTIYPGIDFKVTDWLNLRPTGMAGITDEALDWGVGVGLAVEL